MAFVLIYTSLFHQRNGSSKNTYNMINKLIYEQ